jgi:hypothetical protein
MLRIVHGAVSLAAFCAAFVGAPTREDIAFVTPARAPLVGMVGTAAAPLLAEVLAGCAVHVLERRDGMARISVEGWLPEGSLSKDPPWPQPTVDKKQDVPPATHPSEPVADLLLTHHLDVQAAANKNGDAVEYVVTADLRTEQGRPVVVAGSKQTGRLRIYTQRRVAGEVVKGDVLLDRTVTFEDGKTKLAIPAKELTIPAGTRALFVSIRAELTRAQIVHGAAADVAVAVH